MKRLWETYKIEIIEVYMVAMVCFVTMSGLGMNWITMAIIIGFVNTYMVNPLIKALRLGNVSDEDLLVLNHKLFFKNEIKSLWICTILVCLYYTVDRYLFATGLEPISFGIFYKLIDKGIETVILKVKRKVCQTPEKA